MLEERRNIESERGQPPDWIGKLTLSDSVGSPVTNRADVTSSSAVSRPHHPRPRRFAKGTCTLWRHASTPSTALLVGSSRRKAPAPLAQEACCLPPGARLSRPAAQWLLAFQSQTGRSTAALVGTPHSTAPALHAKEACCLPPEAGLSRPAAQSCWRSSPKPVIHHLSPVQHWNRLRRVGATHCATALAPVCHSHYPQPRPGSVSNATAAAEGGRAPPVTSTA